MTWRAPTALAAAVAAGFGLASPLAAGGLIEGVTADGARYAVPGRWVLGETLGVSGTGWTDLSGTAGSTIAVVYDFGEVRAPDPIGDDDEIWMRIEAAPDGSWSAGLPFPEGAGWAAGEVHRVHFLTGSLGRNDRARGIAAEVAIVAAD